MVGVVGEQNFGLDDSDQEVVSGEGYY